MTPSSERAARALLARTAEPADPEILAQVDVHGPEAVIARLGRGEPRRLADRLRPRFERATPLDDLAIAHRLGARILIPGDVDWPEHLSRIPAPPYALWVRGRVDLARACARSVAVVGARAASAYGLDQAARLAGDLVDRGFTIISGGAFGIDAAAHRGALAADGTTIAVLACGVDRAYPVAHAPLLATIAERGAVVTELPPGFAPFRHRFLQRNRLIAAMSRGTVVVEAALRSGSLNTAATAADYGRPVAAVPGPVTSMASAGCHRAIRDNVAVLVTDAEDVADLVGDLGADAARPARGRVVPGDELPPTQRAVWQVLSPVRHSSIEALAERSALDLGSVHAALGVLEIRGLAERTGDRWRRLRAAL